MMTIYKMFRFTPLAIVVDMINEIPPETV